MKTPHIEISGEVIPEKLLNFLKKEYGKNLIINRDDDEDAQDTDWYKNIKEKTTPGDIVKIYRENKGITQKDFGKMLGGLSRQYVSDVEHNRRGISKDVAKKIAQILNIPVERLL